MKNKDVIEMFLSKKPAKGSNLYSDGKRLVNYYTTLAEWYSDVCLLVNNTRYSVSTSRNQYYLKNVVDNNSNIIPIPINSVPIATISLTDMYEFIKRST